MLPHAGLAEFHNLHLYSSWFHCVSSPPFSPSNVWVRQYSDVSTFAQIPASRMGTCPTENYVATFTFILTLQGQTFDLGTGNTTFTIRKFLIVAGLEDKYISCWVSLDLPSGCSKRKERKNKVHPSPDSEGIMTAASPD